MKTLIRELPAMYGDHHVIEIKGLIAQLPGTGEVYASSSFHTVEIEYDETQVTPAEIESALAEAGYTEALPIPEEIGAVGDGSNGRTVFFRHTAAHEQLGKTIGFAQNVPFSGCPLWPCPGMGLIQREKETEHA